MPKNTSRLTFYEREQIQSHLRTGCKIRRIGEIIGRDHSIVSREIRRNRGEHNPYSAVVAQRISEERSKRTNKRKLEKSGNENLRKYVIEKIKTDWSPEQIAGRLKTKPPPGISEAVSHETIYNYIYNGEGKFERLYPHLRTKRQKRKRKFSRKNRQKIKIPNRVSIHARPEKVNLKQEFGHWETDSMVFKKQKEILSTQYERSSQLCRIHKLPDKTARESENAIAATIEGMPHPGMVKSITRDNGTENALHEKTQEIFNVQSYFCDPYCSWQKGGDENLNKLIRQYLPREINLATVKAEEIYEIEERLNNRPRKQLNYYSPNEVVAEKFGN